MTAAVARPPLFRHLVASNPEHERGSFAATVSSVTLHVALVVAAIVVTARVQAPAQVREPTEIVPIQEYRVDPAPPNPCRAWWRAEWTSGARAAQFSINVPADIPTVIPPAGSMDSMMKTLEQMMRSGSSTSNGATRRRGYWRKPG